MKPKMLITLLMLLMVLSAFSPVQAAQTPKDKPHEKWTMHVGEEKTYVFHLPMFHNSTIISEYGNYHYIQYYNQWYDYDTGKGYVTYLGVNPGNLTIELIHHRDKYFFLAPFIPDKIEYCDMEVLP